MTRIEISHDSKQKIILYIYHTCFCALALKILRKCPFYWSIAKYVSGPYLYVVPHFLMRKIVLNANPKLKKVKLKCDTKQNVLTSVSAVSDLSIRQIF